MSVLTTCNPDLNEDAGMKQRSFKSQNPLQQFTWLYTVYLNGV